MRKVLVALVLCLCLVSGTAHCQTYGPGQVPTSGPVIDSRAYTSLASAILAIGATKTTLVIARAETVNSVTFPSNIVLRFESIGSITVNPMETLTIYSPEHILASPRQQIFPGSGTVTFTRGGTVYPDWWLVNTTPGVTDMYLGVARASVSLAAGGAIKLLGQNYLIGTNLTIPAARGVDLSIPGSQLTAGGGVTLAYSVVSYSKVKTFPILAKWMSGGTSASAAVFAESPYIGDTILAHWNFSSTVLNRVGLQLRMPSDWDLGTIQISFYWGLPAGAGDLTGQTIVWNVRAAIAGNGETIASPTGATPQEVIDTVLAASDLKPLHISAFTSALTPLGTPSADSLLSFFIQRDPTHVSDTVTSSVYLFQVVIRYTTARESGV